MSAAAGIRARAALRLAAAALAALAAWPAQALDYQVHGFAAQGFSLSEHNNYFGDSTHGSTDFYELGLNGAVYLLPNLLVSAQGLLRRAGQTDTEGLRLDYAQVDYRFLSSADHAFGVRLGRVKNPFGFYNETRDVVFTRPGITLPDAVYLEAEGLRSVLFSRDGAQLYGGVQLGEHYLAFEGNYALRSHLSAREQRQLFGSTIADDVDLRNFHVARLEDEWNGGELQFALSYLHGEIAVAPSPHAAISGSLTANMWVASARYNARRFALTGEYLLLQSRTRTSVAPPASTAGDGFYLQGEYRLMPKWTAMARYNASFDNRHDRSGRDYAMQTGADRFSQFSHDETVGLNWQPAERWGVWLEYHLVQGSAAVPAGDNAGRRPADHWNLLQAMVGCRF